MWFQQKELEKSEIDKIEAYLNSNNAASTLDRINKTHPMGKILSVKGHLKNAKRAPIKAIHHAIPCNF